MNTTAYTALYRASLVDDRVNPGDNARADAWQELLDPHEFTESEVIEAVNRYYRDNSKRQLMPSDLIEYAHAVRADNGQSGNSLSDEQREQMIDAKIEQMRSEWRDKRIAQGKPVDGPDGAIGRGTNYPTAPDYGNGPEPHHAYAVPSADDEPTNAVHDAYVQSGAMDHACPRCGAGQRQPCVNPETGVESHTPCVPRIVGRLAVRTAIR